MMGYVKVQKISKNPFVVTQPSDSGKGFTGSRNLSVIRPIPAINDAECSVIRTTQIATANAVTAAATIAAFRMPSDNPNIAVISSIVNNMSANSTIPATNPLVFGC